MTVGDGLVHGHVLAISNAKTLAQMGAKVGAKIRSHQASSGDDQRGSSQVDATSGDEGLRLETERT